MAFVLVLIAGLLFFFCGHYAGVFRFLLMSERGIRGRFAHHDFATSHDQEKLSIFGCYVCAENLHRKSNTSVRCLEV